MSKKVRKTLDKLHHTTELSRCQDCGQGLDLDHTGCQTKDVPNILAQDPDNYTVQSCCLAYGGSSFPGPMRDALQTHLSILRARSLPRRGAGCEKLLADKSNRATILAALLLFKESFEEYDAKEIQEDYPTQFSKADGTLIEPLGSDDIDDLMNAINKLFLAEVSDAGPSQ
jgi:hypothetical protein